MFKFSSLASLVPNFLHSFYTLSLCLSTKRSMRRLRSPCQGNPGVLTSDPPSYLRLFLESVCSILQSMRDSRPFISRIDLPLSLITLLDLDLAVNGTLGLGNAERDGGSCRVNIQPLYYCKQTMLGQRSHKEQRLEIK